MVTTHTAERVVDAHGEAADAGPHHLRQEAVERVGPRDLDDGVQPAAGRSRGGSVGGRRWGRVGYGRVRVIYRIGAKVCPDRKWRAELGGATYYRQNDKLTIIEAQNDI